MDNNNDDFFELIDSAREQMLQAEGRIDLRNFLLSLSLEQLQVLDLMMQAIGKSENPMAQAAFYSGICVTVMDLRHGINFGTGSYDDPVIALKVDDE